MLKPETSPQPFQRAVACLSHPLSLLALGLLLLNDHLLRIFLPGWWTGKLGDFTWCFAFPFALVAVLARIFPREAKRHPDGITLLSLALTGGIFSLVKTWPGFQAGFVRAASWLAGWTVSWRCDPSDLVALPILIGSWWLWRRSAQWRTNPRKPAWMLVSLAACLTVANSAYAPTSGIFCLEPGNGQVIAIHAGGAFTSTDGGLSWQVAEQERLPCESYFYQDTTYDTTSLSEPVDLTDPQNPNVVYRILTGKAILRSTDGGQNWTSEFQPQPLSQALQSYIDKNSLGGSWFRAAPQDALFDPNSGNLILAMGFDGVVVRQPDGAYLSVGVGPFHPQEPGIGPMLLTLFPGEFLMALIFGGLGLVSLAWRGKFKGFQRLVIVGVGLGWALVAWFFPPALQGVGYTAMFAMLILDIAGLVLLPMVLVALIRAGRVSRALLSRSLLVFLGTVVVFSLPFIAWVFNILPYYRLAQVTGILLGCGWVFDQYRRSSKSPEGHSAQGLDP